MINKAWAFALLLCAAVVWAQPDHSSMTSKKRPAAIIAGLGDVHHPIHTKVLDAQQFFDQGLALIYAFNHEEAARSFRRAAELDPASPMPYWGIALAVGPNYNDTDIDHEREKTAYEAIQKARQLAVTAPPRERDYVEALAHCYSKDPQADLKKLAGDYRAAMKQLTARYPDDLDAAALYAASIMNLHPWDLWTLEGKPADGTEEIVAVLQSVLRRDPAHLGANHFYIHAVEASPHPELALASARRLETAAPAAGHLAHMPAHIYERIGNYDGAVQANRAAIKADRAFIQSAGTEGGLYDLMYYSHNLHFLALACSMEGNFACARDAAEKLVAHVEPQAKQMTMLEWFLPMQPWVLARFNRWDEILKSPAPDAELLIDTALWHYARGLAYVGGHDLAKMDEERKTLAAAIPKLPEGTPFGFNSAAAVLNLALNALDARMAEARGDRKTAITLWKKAAALQDALHYDEPPDWYYPVRESLGGALFRDHQYAEAEKVFREDLLHNPGNPRSLFGLWQTLKAQNRTADADSAHQKFLAAWKNADVQLQEKDL